MDFELLSCGKQRRRAAAPVPPDGSLLRGLFRLLVSAEEEERPVLSVVEMRDAQGSAHRGPRQMHDSTASRSEEWVPRGEHRS